MADTQQGPMSADDMGKGIKELVSLGCKFVVEGQLFEGMIDLIDKLLIDGQPDKAGEQFLIQMRGLLLATSKPVKEKLTPPSIIMPKHAGGL